MKETINKGKSKIIEGWIDKASNHLEVAKEHLKSYNRYSEAIEASQECVELSVKSILLLLNIEFSRTHGWDLNKKEFENIAQQIQKRQLQDKLATQHINHILDLPRLLFLANFWAQFYIAAKYGLEVGNLASAKDLFKKHEADLAVQHAEECYRAASHLRYLNQDNVAALL